MGTRISKKENMGSTNRLEPRKKPVQRRSKFTVEQILEAATQVFEKQGYAAGTTNRIAARAGVSIGTLYQYFPNKESLAVALLEEHIHQTGRTLHEWIGHMVSEKHGLEEAMTDYVRMVMEIHEAHPRLQHMLLEETPLPEGVHQLLLDGERNAAKSMAGLLQLFPEVTHGNLEKAGYFVIQTVETLSHRYAAHPDDRIVARDEFIRELTSMLCAYLLVDTTDFA